VTITSGFAGYDLFWFILLSIITRAARFFLVAALLYQYGEPVRGFIEKRLELVTAGIAVIFVGGFVIARYVI
jgi:membrane protein DedA with SNARE-associated domain